MYKSDIPRQVCISFLSYFTMLICSHMWYALMTCDLYFVSFSWFTLQMLSFCREKSDFLAMENLFKLTLHKNEASHWRISLSFWSKGDLFMFTKRIVNGKLRFMWCGRCSWISRKLSLPMGYQLSIVINSFYV